MAVIYMNNRKVGEINTVSHIDKSKYTFKNRREIIPLRIVIGWIAHVQRKISYY